MGERVRATVWLVVAALAVLAPPAAARSRVGVRVLSTRADLVSGGDALVRAWPAGATVAVAGKDVTRDFAVRADGRYEALLTGLRNGSNPVVVASGGSRALLTINNHPLSGPVLSGPHLKPWLCFADTLDGLCNRKVAYEFFYRPAGGGALKPYSLANPPDDVARTTTDTGATVPFIVREEIGTIDRSEYRIAVLFDPRKPWAPWAPQPAFNHRLVIFHGARCDTAFGESAAPNVLNTTALAHGFATMSNGLDNAGANCNVVTEAESLVMTKERFVEQYGPVRYTIGSGCSGGSLVQYQVANAYPGIYQGITPQCSYPDGWSTAMEYENALLLRNYFEHPDRWGPGVVWTADQIAAVEGHPNHLNPVLFNLELTWGFGPSRDCELVPSGAVYSDANPGGVRCTLQDYMVNVFGPREEASWGPAERKLGRGFAGFPIGNVGLQYGLKALKAGTIGAAQFADLNRKVGSFDIDFKPVGTRTDADRPALDRAYRSGAVDQADHLDQVAIIDLRGQDPGAFHDAYRTAVLRARLIREHGTAANMLRWRGPVLFYGDTSFADQSILAMDRWLAAVRQDRRSLPLARKIVADRPASVSDRCTDGATHDVAEASCDAVVQEYSDPQLAAGMPATDDTLRCSLRPLDRAAYGGLTFTDAQWSQLRQAFPSGVCDFTVPDPGRSATVPWLTYQAADGTGVPGGTPLGPAPRSRVVG